MLPRSTRRRPLRTVLGGRLRTALPAGLVLALTGSMLSLGLAAPAQAGNPPQPGAFRGKGFDQCTAPDQRAMTSWLLRSPYQAVGIYISGDQRACLSQPNLTPTWVRNQVAMGWRLLPITLGSQPWCNPRFPRYGKPDMATDPTDRYKKARSQGYAEGARAVQVASGLGIPARSTLWYDLEGYDISTDSCRLPALAFVDGWTQALHTRNYVSGLYSSAASGMRATFDERTSPSAYRWRLPDRVWIADWDGRVNVHSEYLNRTSWMRGNRMKQYRGGHNETWGGTTINIDNDWLVLGSAWRLPGSAPHCGNVGIDFRTYPGLGRKNYYGAQKKALQCLLKEKGFYDGAIDGVYDRAVIDAANAFRRTVGLPDRDRWGWADWVALLSDGWSTTLKPAARGAVVQRLQRALNAGVRQGLAINGEYDAPTRDAVRAYQAQVGLARTGYAVPSVWRQLKRGAR